MFVLATLVIGSTLCQGVCLSGGGYLLLSSVPAFGDALVASGKALTPKRHTLLFCGVDVAQNTYG